MGKTTGYGALRLGWSTAQPAGPTLNTACPQTPSDSHRLPQPAPNSHHFHQLPPTTPAAGPHTTAGRHAVKKRLGAGPAALECASAPTGLLLPPRAVLIGAAVTALVVWLRRETRLALAGRALKPQQFS